MEGIAPALVVAIAPAAEPQRIASFNGFPSITATANPPLKESPAATVSIEFTMKDGTKPFSCADS